MRAVIDRAYSSELVFRHDVQGRLGYICTDALYSIDIPLIPFGFAVVRAVAGRCAWRRQPEGEGVPGSAAGLRLQRKSSLDGVRFRKNPQRKGCGLDFHGRPAIERR